MFPSQHSVIYWSFISAFSLAHSNGELFALVLNVMSNACGHLLIRNISHKRFFPHSNAVTSSFSQALCSKDLLPVQRLFLAVLNKVNTVNVLVEGSA